MLLSNAFYCYYLMLLYAMYHPVLICQKYILPIFWGDILEAGVRFMYKRITLEA